MPMTVGQFCLLFISKKTISTFNSKVICLSVYAVKSMPRVRAVIVPGFTDFHMCCDDKVDSDSAGLSEGLRGQSFTCAQERQRPVFG